MTEKKAAKFLHRLYGLCAFALGLLYLPLAGLWISCDPSPFGWVIVVAGCISWVGLILGSRGSTGPIFSFASVLIIVGALGIHHVAANSATDVYVRLLSSPTPLSSPQPVPEHDLASVGARVLNMMGYFAERGQKGPDVTAMSGTYKDAQGQHFALPSPMLASRKDTLPHKDFDILVFEPKEFTGKAIVFLHGYGGNWAMPCWMVAREANAKGFRVYCPTLDFRADWTTSAGRRIVGKMLGMLRDEGIGTVILGGLSNGAVGASILTRQFSGQIDGVLLISGAARNATSVGKPFLVFHGKEDSMSPISNAKSYAAAYPDKGKLHQLEGGHFAVLEHREIFWTDLAHFLGQF